MMKPIEEKNDKDDSVEAEKTVGYFSILNLNFFATDEDIKRNYSELCKLYVEDHSGNFELKDMNNSKDLLDKVSASYFILEDKEVRRKNYLHMLSIIYYLAQPFDIETVVSKYASRIFPYTIFEVEKKMGSSFSLRILKFDFLDRTLTEYKEEKYFKAFNFSSIIGGITGFKKDEFLINVLESNDTCIHHYRVKYLFQRDLIVQIILLAKDVHEKRNSQLLTHKNPNTEKFAETKPKIVRQSDIKLMNNDRLVPPMSLKKCIISKKPGNIVNDNKLFLTLGICQLIISKDENCNDIVSVIPLNGKAVSVSKSKENAGIYINTNEDKLTFYFCNDEESIDFCKIVTKILNKFLIKENTIITLPHIKQDSFITKLKRDKLKKIFKKIEETEKYLEELNSTKMKLEEEIFNEENPVRSLATISRGSIMGMDKNENENSGQMMDRKNSKDMTNSSYLRKEK